MRERVEAFDVSFDGHTIRRTISIGIASYPAETIKNADALLAAADHALYAA